MTPTEEFLKEIERFIKKHKMSATSFGLKSLSDPSFVKKVRDGRSPSLEVAGRVRNWMKTYTPETNGDKVA